MRRIVVVVPLVLAIGCHKAATGDDDGQTFTDAPALVGVKHELTWGPITVPAGKEDTQCIWLRLDNAAAIKVHQIDNVLSEVSHHLIVYKDDMDTTEQTTPIDCQGFTGALNSTGMIAPIVITQKHADEVTLPDAVAYTLAPNQMIKLEMHYINTSDMTPETAMATVDFYEADPATIKNEAAILFAGSLDIDILPGQMATLHQFFTVPTADVDLSQSHIFAITGHEHHLGTNVQVNVGTSKTDPAMKPVYNPNPFLWSEPVTQNQAPDFAIPTGSGLDFTCSWTNTTNAEVKFGESATAEMCFFWMYYWPSQGSKVCLHTDMYNGFNVCCPGDSLCSFIEGMIPNN